MNEKHHRLWRFHGFVTFDAYDNALLPRESQPTNVRPSEGDSMLDTVAQRRGTPSFTARTGGGVA
jgi:hypothetical protein